MTPINNESAALNQNLDSPADIDPAARRPLSKPPRAYVGSLVRSQVRGELVKRPHVPSLRDVTSRPSPVSVQRLPHENKILAGLPHEDYQRLLQRLEPIQLRPGLIVSRAGAAESDLYFPIDGIVSRYCVTQDGATTELAATGREGVVGVASFLGGDESVGEAVALTAGAAYRLRGDLVKAEFERHCALPRALLGYTQALIAHIGQIAVCNRHHSLDQQLCRWILTSSDRLTSNELMVTHETIARMLGVRREGVTRAATKLRDAGLIDYSRGRISIINRKHLEFGACECHSVIRRVYEKLHQPSGPTATASQHRPISSARAFPRNRGPRVLPLRTIETL